MRNHTRNNCYRLIGYPTNYKFTRRRVDGKGNKTQHDRFQNSGGNGRAQVNNVNFIDNFEVGRNPTPDALTFKSVLTFTPDQYGQIIKLFDKEDTSQEVIASMAGIQSIFSFTSQTCNSCSVTGKDTPPWIMDTGATNHMVSSLDKLLSPTLVPPNTSNV